MILLVFAYVFGIGMTLVLTMKSLYYVSHRSTSSPEAKQFLIGTILSAECTIIGTFIAESVLPYTFTIERIGVIIAIIVGSAIHYISEKLPA